jgi:hypothetical protein
VARLTPDQYKALTRYRFGLRKTRPPGVPRLGPVNGPYAYVYARWAMFVPWRSWRDRGGPRPPGVWKVVPRWDGWTPWDLLKEIRVVWPVDGTHPVPPLPYPQPPGPVTPSLAFGQCWFVIAQDYRSAGGGPGYFGRAFTADQSYARPSKAEVQAYRDMGVRTAVWGDSRPAADGDGTSPEQIVAVANQLGVDKPMFQAELNREYAAAVRMIDSLGGNGYPLILNRSQIATDAGQYADLVSRINRGNVYGISECYKNCGWGDPDWGGLPMACTLGATYRDGQCSGSTQDFYYDNGLLVPHRDSWYTAGWDRAMYAAAR